MFPLSVFPHEAALGSTKMRPQRGGLTRGAGVATLGRLFSSWERSMVHTEADTLRRKLYRRMGTTLRDYDLIRDGDRVMVCLSGGKDSYTLFDLLVEHQRRSPVRYELIGVHLDQGQPGYDGAPLAEWLRAFGAPHEIIHRDTYSIVMSLVEEGDTYCAPCARLRRGTLYGAAERLGCNVIALGHHLDDALETFMLNMFYGGKLQTMPAGYTTDDGRYRVVRPLVETPEAEIAAYARLAAYPILPCNLCGSQPGLKRDQMGALLQQLSETIPDVRNVMLAALKNVRATHLLDRKLVARLGAEVRESAEPPNPDALPVVN